MKPPRAKPVDLEFFLLDFADADRVDLVIDSIDDFVEDSEWALSPPNVDAYEENDDHIQGAVTLKVAKTPDADAARLLEFLRGLSAQHHFSIEVDLADETIGTITQGVASEGLAEKV